MMQRQFPATRMRRLRQADWSRRLVGETSLSVSDLIWPIFIIEGENETQTVASMPGVLRMSIDLAVNAAKQAASLGIPVIALFPNTPADARTDDGHEALNPDNLVCRATRAIKEAVPEIGILCDVALDPYTDHGHDGLMDGETILNDATIDVLVGQTLNQVAAGCDIIAPSDMMDGRVKLIREELDKQNKQNTGILSYSAKFSSAYYGPFRDAIGTGQKTAIDKSCYQLDPANLREAKRELELDFEEGADILMIKPAEPYLDVIKYARENFNIPIAAYQVSGEYSRIWASHLQGWLDLESCALESMHSIKRAGANIIFTYFAERIAKII